MWRPSKLILAIHNLQWRGTLGSLGRHCRWLAYSPIAEVWDALCTVHGEAAAADLEGQEPDEAL